MAAGRSAFASMIDQSMPDASAPRLSLAKVLRRASAPGHQYSAVKRAEVEHLFKGGALPISNRAYPPVVKLLPSEARQRNVI